MPKLKTRYVCQVCGSAQPKWQGKCPDCGEWNTLVETVVQEPASGPDGQCGHRRRRLRTRGAPRHPRRRLRAHPGAHRRAEPRAGRRDRARLRGADQRGSGDRKKHAAYPALPCGAGRGRRAGALRLRRGIGCADQAARRAAGHRHAAHPGAGRHAPGEHRRAHREDPAQDGRRGLGAEHLLRRDPIGRGQRDPGARLLGVPVAAGEVADLPALPGGPRDQGGRHRRPARARTHGGHRALPGRRAVPLLPAAALRQEPLRLHQRGRRLRDGREGAGRGQEPVRGVPGRAAAQRGRVGHRGDDGGHAADPGRGAGADQRRPRSPSRGAPPTAWTSTGCC